MGERENSSLTGVLGNIHTIISSSPGQWQGGQLRCLSAVFLPPASWYKCLNHMPFHLLRKTNAHARLIQLWPTHTNLGTCNFDLGIYLIFYEGLNTKDLNTPSRYFIMIDSQVIYLLIVLYKSQLTSLVLFTYLIFIPYWDKGIMLSFLKCLI